MVGNVPPPAFLGFFGKHLRPLFFKKVLFYEPGTPASFLTTEFTFSIPEFQLKLQSGPCRKTW